MPDSIEYCKIIMYVDDTGLFIDGNCENANTKMASDLKCLFQWANVWQLQLNVKKCGVMHIGHNNPKFNFVLNNETRQKICSMKDLGVIIGNTLHFNEYTDKSIAKVYRMCYSVIHGFYTNSIDFMIMFD